MVLYLNSATTVQIEQRSFVAAGESEALLVHEIHVIRSDFAIQAVLAAVVAAFESDRDCLRQDSSAVNVYHH